MELNEFLEVMDTNKNSRLKKTYNKREDLKTFLQLDWVMPNARRR